MNRVVGRKLSRTSTSYSQAKETITQQLYCNGSLATDKFLNYHTTVVLQQIPGDCHIPELSHNNCATDPWQMSKSRTIAQQLCYNGSLATVKFLDNYTTVELQPIPGNCQIPELSHNS
ncbi:hypothetical protein ElyMa_004553100 [Elysia marginata]|uniref:Uncharacterized protein n=1 Tax=Elysia marginata TaxID=1093978 RepID=A0AAV4HTL6_9GAST|nr:hypothetical protein ElyMa_004553100 [Elysia marginata]